MVEVNSLKVLSCVLWDDVLCPFRKDERVGIMHRCLKCRQYWRFLGEMEKEEEEFFEEVERLRREALR